MAEKRLAGAQPGPPGTNLLFSDSDFSFSVPFIPVSQPSAELPVDATEVGEEDSFLGQTSATVSKTQTFSYFAQPTSLGGSNDPFAAIAQPPLTTTPPSSGSAAFTKPPALTPAFGPLNGQTQAPLPTSNLPFISNNPPASKVTTSVLPPASQHCPPPTAYPAAPTGSLAGYNPYRHNVQSSRINPYLTPPQLQEQIAEPHSQPSQFAPPGYGYQGPPAPLPPPTTATPPLPPLAAHSYPHPRPAVPLAPGSSPFMQNLYEPLQPHWFFSKQVEGKEVWQPFSVYDSLNLEKVYNSVQPDPESVVVSTDGGRYDVYLYDRERKAVYWEEEDSEVRRCSWFYKGDTDSRFTPYSEEFSEKLEAEYKKAVTTNQWHRRLEFPGGETIVMHNPKVIVQFQHSAIPDEWGTHPDGQSRPRVVRRGIDDDHDEIPLGEVPQVDHLVFMVHGIGPVCDLRFRSIVECVDDFRTVSLKLLRTHFKRSFEDGRVSRVEFLPVHWHSALHGDATGVDRRIKKISLPSIGRLRHFTNETLLDILFYNSPTYCQTIVDKVSLELNRLYEVFMSRNPSFNGSISVAGHSLGSLILFDLLSNQTDLTSTPAASMVPLDINGLLKSEATDSRQMPGATLQDKPQASDDGTSDPDLGQEELPNLQEALETLSLAEYGSVFEKEKIDMESLLMCTVDDLKEMGIPLGPRKKISKFVEERAAHQVRRKAAAEQRAAQIKVQEELVASRSEEAALRSSLPNAGRDLEPSRKKLPVGASVSNVHVDYEYFEIGTGQVSVQYNRLDFKPVNFFALGSPIGMFLTVRGLDKIDEQYRLPTCKGFFNIYHPLDPVAYRLEPMILPDMDLKPVLIPHHKGRKRLHLELKESLTRMGSDLKQGFISSLRMAWQTLNDFARAHTASTQLQLELKKVADQIQEEEAKQQEVEVEKLENPEASREEELAVKIGMLNGGRRIDYVLQEKPIESFNEYLFALQSHLCYWESEDTALLILKEIYGSMNIIPDHLLH